MAQASEIVAERWTPLILRELLCGSERFNELKRGLPRISPSMLSRRLDQLEGEGLLERREDEEGPRYHLTPAGEELRPVVEALGRWGKRWLPTELDPEDLDPSLLMWDLQRRVDPGELPEERVVVRFHYPDAEKPFRRWWVLLGPDEVDLCLKPPGYSVDLSVQCDVETMVRIWLGDLDLASAMAEGRLELEGPEDLRRRFSDWLGLSMFAEVRRSRVRET
ncbi:MAG: winged helix-turn-helix transcriptional regulator [Thermoanaerobaculia bacterium]|nr:winged helix-turn-helix transcriptional regulator [Thermoanaerobaculia bacterium]